MPNEKSAMEEFLGDIPVANQQEQQGDMFNQSLVEEEVETTPATTEETLEPKKNRYHRRLEQKYQAEREANIRMAALLEAKSESQQFARDTETVDERLLRLYGDNESGRAAAKITQDLLTKTKEEAREEALNVFRQEQEREQQAVAESSNELDEMLETIEDEFDIDLTSDTPAARRARQGFFSTLEEMSPKNREGVVTDYADPLATWKYYQTQQKPDNNRAKDLASRSMSRSGASGESKLEATAQERFLKDAGII